METIHIKDDPPPDGWVPAPPPPPGSRFVKERFRLGRSRVPLLIALVLVTAIATMVWKLKAVPVNSPKATVAVSPAKPIVVATAPKAAVPTATSTPPPQAAAAKPPVAAPVANPSADQKQIAELMTKVDGLNTKLDNLRAELNAAKPAAPAIPPAVAAPPNAAPKTQTAQVRRTVTRSPAQAKNPVRIYAGAPITDPEVVTLILKEISNRKSVSQRH